MNAPSSPNPAPIDAHPCGRRWRRVTGEATPTTLLLALHRIGPASGPNFVWKHRLFRLVCIQCFASVLDAIAQEKCLKKWRRHWKIQLIEKDNPEWRDLFDELLS
jgi:putative endonuclease